MDGSGARSVGQLHRVEAMVHPQNTASVALLERLGFIAEGTLREAGFWNGQRHDLMVLGLLTQAWPEHSLKNR